MNGNIFGRFKGDLELLLKLIENEKNYYAMFAHVLESCTTAELKNRLLNEAEEISDMEFVENLNRIQRAKKNAIKIHGEWTIKAFERSKTQYTPRTFVSSVYSDIWRIELPGEPSEVGTK